MDKVLILGGSGMLGNAMYRYFTNGNKFKTVTAIRNQNLPGASTTDKHRIISGVDAGDWRNIKELVRLERPNYIINCVGVIKQDPRIKDLDLVMRINSILPKRLDLLCAEFDIRLLHFSTDCVFSGETGNYSENMMPDCEDNYGLSKQLGEVSSKNSCTLRTSIIGQEISRKASLVEWLLSSNGKTISGFKNAIFSGLPTVTLARIIHDNLLESDIYGGLFHISSEPISKYDLLVRLRDKFNLEIMIKPEFRFRINRSLSYQKLKWLTSYRPPTWSELINELYDSWLYSD